MKIICKPDTDFKQIYRELQAILDRMEKPLITDSLRPF